MTDEKEVLEKLNTISEKLSVVSEGQNTTNAHLMKIVYALIGLIGASLGLKFVGSPPFVIFAAFVSFFVATYLLAATLFQWRQMKWLLRGLRLVFSLFIYYSVICRTIILTVMAPEWYRIGVDFFFIVLGLLLILISWKFWENNKFGHDRADKY